MAILKSSLTRVKQMWRRVVAVMVGGMAVCGNAHASTNTSLTMLETPLQTLQSSLQGPVAMAIGIIAVVITGAMLIFGGEIGDFGKRMAYVVLVLGILLTANTLVPALFSTATAIIF
jgi:type IV secretory pathway VirB2 component (pilin)